MLMFSERIYGALLLSSSIMVASQYLCLISRLPSAWWRNPGYILHQPVCLGSSEGRGSRCLGEVHRVLVEVKIVQYQLMEVIGFYPPTPPFNTKPYWWKCSVCRMVRGGTSWINHPGETVGGFRRAFPSCAVVQSGSVGPAAALLGPALAQTSEEAMALAQSIKSDHLLVT